jgi:hypothetical protein
MYATRGRIVLAFALLAGCTSNLAGPAPEDAAQNPGPYSYPDLSMDPNPSADLGGTGAAVVRFVAMGDTGKGNEKQKAVAAAIVTKCAKDGCDFVQLLGDNIYDSGVSSTSDTQWQDKFEVPYAAIQLPFWAVLGNHDYGGGGTGNEFGKGQNEVDYTKVSSKWKMPAEYWHRTEKHVEFFGLDTNKIMWSMASQQKTDVTQWLAASTAQWKIALGHHPYFSNGPHGNAGSYEGLPFIPIANGAAVKDFFDSTVCGKVDLYLCGHDHSMQWLQGQCKGTELMVSGAGASSTELKGSNATHFQTLEVGFTYIAIDGNKLTAEFLDSTGKSLYTRSMMK